MTHFLRTQVPLSTGLSDTDAGADAPEDVNTPADLAGDVNTPADLAEDTTSGTGLDASSETDTEPDVTGASVAGATEEGVRTYRGRKLEDLIPRIRAELGPDAIILRERQGVTGGIGGFFAQRCVEVEAKAAPRVDVYANDFEDDDDEDYEAEDYEAEAYGRRPFGRTRPPAPPAASAITPAAQRTARPAEAQPAASPAQPDSFRAFAAPDLAEEHGTPAVPAMSAMPIEVAAPEITEIPEVPAAPEIPEVPAAPESSEVPAAPENSEAAAPEQPRWLTMSQSPAAARAPESPVAPAIFDEASFASALEEATLAVEHEPDLDEQDALWEPDPEPPAPSPQPLFIAFDEIGPDEPNRPEPEPEPAVPEPEIPETIAAAEPEAEPAAGEPEPEAIAASEPEAEPAAAEPEPAPAPAEPEPEAIAVAPDTPSAAPRTPAPVLFPVTSRTPVPFPMAPHPAAATPGRASRRRRGIAPMAERMIRAALAARDAAPDPLGPHPPAQPFTPPSSTPERSHDARDHDRAAELERRLVDCGFTAARAGELVAEAIAGRGPFSGGGDLEEHVRAAIAGALPEPRMLPVDGGAFAIVGAGGSGKTHCVAALAAAHARAGVAPVSVARLGVAGTDNELVTLLRGEDVRFIPGMHTEPMAREVSAARGRGLVIIDTAAAAPGDASALEVLAEALRPFELDGVYLTVPATLSPRAAARLAQGFAVLTPTGLIVTHVDEADQLGTIAELAMQSGIPIGYLHSGTNLQTAVAAAGRDQLAAEIMR